MWGLMSIVFFKFDQLFSAHPLSPCAVRVSGSAAVPCFHIHIGVWRTLCGSSWAAVALLARWVSLATPAAICDHVGALGGSGCILSALVMLCPSSASPAALAHPVPLCCVSGRLASALAVGGSASAPPILSASAPPLLYTHPGVSFCIIVYMCTLTRVCTCIAKPCMQFN